MFEVRAFFSKAGNAKYISHLDLYRSMGRALKRADLPVWMTEGFNPHIYMTFALPLALGIEGVKEPMDFRLTCDLNEVGFDEITERLNAVMPQGLRIGGAAAPVHRATEIEKARYEVNSVDIAKAEEFLSGDSIIIEKKSKNKTQTIDIKPLISFEFANDKVTLVLPAGNTLNINPWQVFQGFEIGGVVRTAILLGDGKEFM